MMALSRQKYLCFLLVSIGYCWGGLAVANNNIDLSTIPQRDSVQLTIYNAEDLTLVRETRTLSFKKGRNPLQFSWANTLIDPTSVELKFLSQADKLELLDTTFPHDKPEVLYWQVESEHDGAATLEISYFTSGISWAADYVAIANPEETELQLESFVRVTNNSGEDYENAQVRLVVGTINLVEAIEDLASSFDEDGFSILAAEADDTAGRRALKKEMRRQEGMAIGGFMANEPASLEEVIVASAKDVAKESLSEYFIYTIEGTETIPSTWSKRLNSFVAEAVPIKVEYRYRPREYGEQLVRLYLSVNDTDSKLGTTPLPEGQIRIFRQQPQGSLSYLTEIELDYTPIGDKVELNLGEDPEVIFELIPLKVFRDDIWMRLSGADVYRRADDGQIQADINSRIAGWNEHTIYTQRIRNYTAKPINVEMRRAYGGDVVFRSQLKPKQHDFQTVQFETTIDAGEKADLHHEVIQREGRNYKKDNLELEAGAVDL